MVLINDNKIHFYPLLKQKNKTTDRWRYQTDLMYLDIRKAYIKNALNKPSHYCLLVKAELKDCLLEKFNKQLDFNEQRYLLENACHSLINTYPFSFKDFLFKRPISLDNTNMSMFKKHEILKGRTIADLYAGDVTMIQKGLEFELDVKQKQKTYANETLIEEMLNVDDVEDRLIWRNIKIFDQNSVMLISSDFYQENIIARAIEMKNPKAAWLVISFILENFESHYYQIEIMKSLDSILSVERIDLKVMEFFDMDD
jgi:hypothetical protein